MALASSRRTGRLSAASRGRLSATGGRDAGARPCCHSGRRAGDRGRGLSGRRTTAEWCGRSRPMASSCPPRGPRSRLCLRRRRPPSERRPLRVQRLPCLHYRRSRGGNLAGDGRMGPVGDRCRRLRDRRDAHDVVLPGAVRAGCRPRRGHRCGGGGRCRVVARVRARLAADARRRAPDRALAHAHARAAAHRGRGDGGQARNRARADRERRGCGLHQDRRGGVDRPVAERRRGDRAGGARGDRRDQEAPRRSSWNSHKEREARTWLVQSSRSS